VKPNKLVSIGFSNSAHDLSEILFPQDVRNCTKCHGGTGATCSATTPCGIEESCVSGKCANVAYQMAMGLGGGGMATSRSPRTPQGSRTQCIRWKPEIAALLKDNCGSCHSGATPADGLGTADYLAVLGGGDAPVRTLAAEANSRLLQVIAKDSATTAHRPVSRRTATTRSMSQMKSTACRCGSQR